MFFLQSPSSLLSSMPKLAAQDDWRVFSLPLAFWSSFAVQLNEVVEVKALEMPYISWSHIKFDRVLLCCGTGYFHLARILIVYK
jgi:hypothetical protein